MPSPVSQSQPQLTKALEQMTAALAILDEVEAPGEIGATLGLAVARLRQILGHDGNSGMDALFSQLPDELSHIRSGVGKQPDPSEIPPV